MEGVVWVADTGALARATAQVGSGPLALDLEADSFHHFRDKVCLVQMSFGAQDVLVDPLAGADLRVLGAVLADAGVRKVMHGADYDLRLLGRDHGLSVAGLFDTMVAARLCGERAFGLAALLEAHLGVRLDKTHQRADWSVRPLPPAMVAYAVEDTRSLIALAERLEERLAALGRTAWAAEEFDRLVGVRWSEASDPEPWRRIKGCAGLDRRRLAVVREVATVREALARERDRPLFRILRDETVLALAERRPSTPAELARVPGMPRPLLGGAAGRYLLEAIARAVAAPEEDLPEVRRTVRVRPSPAFEAHLGRLRDARDHAAAELDIEPSLLASRGVLETVAARLEAGEPPRPVPELRAWQAGVLLPLWEMGWDMGTAT